MRIARARTVAVVAVLLQGFAGQSSVFAQGPPPAGLNVNVTNSSSNPVSVRETDNPAFHAITIVFKAQSTDAAATRTLSTNSYTIPNGKRLVIEHISAMLLTSSSFQWFLRMVESTPGAPSLNHAVGVSSGTVQCSSAVFCGGTAQPAKIYVDQGHSLQPIASFNSAAGTSMTSVEVIVTGQLVDLP